MSRRDLGLGLVGGLVVGALGGWSLGRSGSSAQAAAVVSAVPTVDAAGGAAAACPPCPVEAPTGAVDLREVVKAQDQQIRGLSDVAFGRPLVWPDPAMPTAIQQALAEELARCPELKLLETDCSEPPCLVAFDLGIESGGLSDVCPTRFEWTGPLSTRQTSSAQKTCPDGSKRMFTAVALGDRALYQDANEVPGLDFDDNERTRFRVRFEDLKDTFVCR